MDSRIDDDLLQRYFDGDLAPSETASVRAQLDGSEADRTRLGQLERMKELLVAVVNDDVGDVPSEAIFEGVRGAIGDRPPLRVVPGGSRGKRTIVFGALVLAAAAAVVFMLNSRTEHVHPGETVAGVETPTPPPRSPSGSQVEEVDFGMNAGTVFAVEGDSGESLAVIWINDDKVLQ